MGIWRARQPPLSLAAPTTRGLEQLLQLQGPVALVFVLRVVTWENMQACQPHMRCRAPSQACRRCLLACSRDRTTWAQNDRGNTRNRATPETRATAEAAAGGGGSAVTCANSGVLVLLPWLSSHSARAQVSKVGALGWLCAAKTGNTTDHRVTQP